MAKNDVIWVEGEKELYLNMQKSMFGTVKAGREALQKAALQIVADAVQNIRNNKSWTTGGLANSGKVQRVEGSEDEIDAGFFSTETTGGYAAYVEYGTRGGGERTIKSMIPRITQWLIKKGKFGANGKSLAFFISRKIVRRGTRPHPFLAPAVEKNKKAVEKAITEGVKESIK
jgi:HK97 gp10 family phage protein